jgi:hypothetical protein
MCTVESTEHCRFIRFSSCSRALISSTKTEKASSKSDQRENAGNTRNSSMKHCGVPPCPGSTIPRNTGFINNSGAAFRLMPLLYGRFTSYSRNSPARSPSARSPSGPRAESAPPDGRNRTAVTTSQRTWISPGRSDYAKASKKGSSRTQDDPRFRPDPLDRVSIPR